MDKPLISIIVPIYNVELYLDICLTSITKQSNHNFITLLINDGSTDNSQSIAECYVENHPELFTLYNKENGGLSDARNFGVAKANTEYVIFVDSDDIIALDTIKRLLNSLNEQPCDMLCFGMTEISESGEHIRNIPPTTGSLKSTNLAEHPELITQALPNACNKVIRTSLFTENAVSFPHGLWYEDLATIPKLFDLANSINFLPENLYHYRTREGSITQTISPKILDMITVLSSLDNYFDKKNNRQLDDALLTLKANMLMKTLVRIAACNDQQLQRQMIKQVQKHLKEQLPQPIKIMSLKAKPVYKFTLALTAFKLNSLLLKFLSICIKRGLISA